MNAREAAYLSLVRCENGGKYSNIEIDAAIKRYGLTQNERSLYTALVYGVTERRITLDYMISAMSSRDVKKIEPSVMELLRLGAYQIMYLDRVPDSAACNETVELAKKYTHKGAYGFINGVLRTLARRKESLPYPEKGTIEYDSVYNSCPEWICRLWAEQYGEEAYRSALAGINSRPGITLRVNTLRTTRDGLAERLEEDGIGFRFSEVSPYGILLNGSTPVTEIKPLSEGLCFVQDEASQLCGIALGAESGETVIDACACPGGKSFSIAMQMENRGRLMSFDLHESKMSLVRSGAERLGIGIIEASVCDGRKRVPELEGIADRVLCDVPCSGLGVMAKKPDIRYKTYGEIKKLPEIQYSILENCSGYVKDGGVLVYSTCTLNKEENENNVNRFLSMHGEYGYDREDKVTEGGIRTFFPGNDGTDGFFIAKLKKKH